MLSAGFMSFGAKIYYCEPKEYKPKVLLLDKGYIGMLPAPDVLTTETNLVTIEKDYDYSYNDQN